MIACLSYAVVFYAFGWHEGLTLAAVVLLLLCSALVSGSEAAFFSLSPRNIAHLKSVPDRSGRAILRLLGMPDYLLALSLIHI